MGGYKRLSLIMTICLVCLTIPACDELDDHNWGEVGVVIDSTVGCWIIVVGELGSEDATYYEPTNLDDRFKEHGLWVRFEYVELEGWVSICMVGPPITLTRIEEI